MNALAHRILAPSAQDAALARVSGQRLARYARERRALTLRPRDADQDNLIELPAGAVALLMDILEAVAAGRGVTIIPEDAELMTVEAAEALSVSRPSLVKLLDEGPIPHRNVGRHRRIRMEDVIAYKARDDRKREAALNELVREAQQLDMGYGRP